MPDNSTTDTLKSDIAACKQYKQHVSYEWSRNIDYLRGTDAATGVVLTQRRRLNKDWSMVKSKVAALFSQVPKIRLSPRNPAFAPAAPVFAKVVNDVIDREKVGTVIDAVLRDVLNASGVGAAMVCYEARTEPVEVPAIDPATLGPDQQLALGNVPNTDTTNAANISSGTLALARLPVISQIATATVGSDQTTTSGSMVDLPGASVTMTTEANSIVVLMWTGPLKISNGSIQALMTFRFDSTDNNVQGVTQATTDQTITFFTVFTGLSAGSHTFKVRFRTSDGSSTATINGGSVCAGQFVAIEIKK